MFEPRDPKSQPLWLSRREVPDYIFRRHGVRITVSTLETKASRGGGPPFSKFGKDTLYKPAEVDSWVAAKLRHVAPEGV